MASFRLLVAFSNLSETILLILRELLALFGKNTCFHPTRISLSFTNALRLDFPGGREARQQNYSDYSESTEPSRGNLYQQNERESHGGGHGEMPMQRYKPEQIVTVLRQIEVAGVNGKLYV